MYFLSFVIIPPGGGTGRSQPPFKVTSGLQASPWEDNIQIKKIFYLANSIDFKMFYKQATRFLVAEFSWLVTVWAKITKAHQRHRDWTRDWYQVLRSFSASPEWHQLLYALWTLTLQDASWCFLAVKVEGIWRGSLLPLSSISRVVLRKTRDTLMRPEAVCRGDLDLDPPPWGASLSAAAN